MHASTDSMYTLHISVLGYQLLAGLLQFWLLSLPQPGFLGCLLMSQLPCILLLHCCACTLQDVGLCTCLLLQHVQRHVQRQMSARHPVAGSSSHSHNASHAVAHITFRLEGSRPRATVHHAIQRHPTSGQALRAPFPCHSPLGGFLHPHAPVSACVWMLLHTQPRLD